MSTSNPTVLDQSTRFRPATTRRQSRSPSRSPVRKAQFTAQEIDPLLGNLSPTSTLKALSLTEVLGTNQSRDADLLACSITETSTDERAYGIRAALAAQKLREWHAEVQGWKWPAKKDRRFGKGFQPRPGPSPREKTSSPSPKHKEYVGSLPRAVVAQHEERIEQIKDGLEALDVEELKEHVLSAHIPSRSKDGEANASHHGFFQLSDFSAVITHTMLQALPYLSKLTALLNDWDIRIIVLNRVPQLLRQLEKTEIAIDSASESLYSRRPSGLLTRACFEDTKVVLGRDVSLLGATFDKVLDQLEGREDSLPETWIERMDTIEANFAQWTVESERRVLYNEWMEQNKTSTLERQGATEVSTPTEGTTSTDEIVALANGQVQSLTCLDEGLKNGNPVGLKHEQFPSRHAISRNQQPNPDPKILQSSIDPEFRGALAVNAEPVAPLPGEGQDGALMMNKPQSVASSREAPDLATPSQRAQETKEKLSKVTSEDEKTSLVAPSLLPDERPPASPTAAKTIEQEARQAPELTASTVDNFGMSSTPQMEVNHPPSDYVPTSTDEILSEHHSGVGGFRSAPSEAIHKVTDERYSLPPDHEGSSLVNGLPQVKQPLTLSLPLPNHRRGISDISMADSTVSEAFSDISNAEIVNATTAEALGSPKIIRQSVRASRDDWSKSFIEPKLRIQSMHLRPNSPIVDPAEKRHKKAASMSFDKINSPFALPIKASDTVADSEDDADSAESMADQPTSEPILSCRAVIHRASLSSMEKIPKNRIRSIMVNRSHSSSSSVVSPISPLDTSGPYAGSGSAMSVSPLENDSSTSLGKKFSRRDYFEGVGRKEETFPVPKGGALQVADRHTDTPGVPRRSSKRLSRGPNVDSVPTLSIDTKDCAANSSHEPQDVHSVLQSWSTGPSTAKIDDNGKPRTPSKGKGKSHEDLLESKIQSLLTRIPARIRLLSDSDPGSPPHPSTASSSRSQSPIPSIILSPVKQKCRPQANNGGTPNSDVRMFHLTRSTESQNTPPIKLFVRLVGEHGERVMVRVGGGWADLGDYLRDYSLHHSKRGLHNGQFELASLPVSGQKDGKDSRVIPIGPELISKATTPGHILSKSRSPANSRPGSALDHRPSAVTPFGILRPTRRRRSTPAIATHESDALSHDSSSSSPIYPFPSVADNINTYWETPPVPSVPQIRTLNPYFGGDPRSSGPPRQLPGAAATPSSHSTITPTPRHSHSQTIDRSTPTAPGHAQQKQRRTSLGSAGAGSGAVAVAKSKLGYPPTSTRSRIRPTTPAANRIAIDPEDPYENGAGGRGGGGGGGGGGAPAPTIGSTYSSPTGGGVGPSKSRMSSLGDKGGIRRVFFRRKSGGVGL